MHLLQFFTKHSCTKRNELHKIMRERRSLQEACRRRGVAHSTMEAVAAKNTRILLSWMTCSATGLSHPNSNEIPVSSRILLLLLLLSSFIEESKSIDHPWRRWSQQAHVKMESKNIPGSRFLQQAREQTQVARSGDGQARFDCLCSESCSRSHAPSWYYTLQCSSFSFWLER
jgi:hypothetical protein